MKSKPVLELIDISKGYEQTPLLRSISFQLHTNETICLLGASGSGKSTLLKMIAGLESPENGRILFNGIDLAHTPPHLRDFGLVFQDYGLFPHLDVFDNVAFGLKMRNIPIGEIKRRVASLLNQVNLNGFEKRSVTELSGGEQQRVALARALAPNPRLLMFDEPLGALDRTLKDELLNVLRDVLHRSKVPAIYVTHDQEEAFAIADRILFLHDREILRDGTPAEVWKNPRSGWVAEFLGVGKVVQGKIKGKKIITDYGLLDLNCKHQHKENESIPVLIRQGEGGGQEIKVKVEDVLFKRDQFEVRARGGFTFHMKEAPKVGRVLTVKVKVECLA